MTAALADMNDEMEKVMGTAQKERLSKLLRFLNMIVGTNYERGMLVLTWVISAAAAVVDTTQSNYAASLLVQSITALVQARTSQSISAQARKAPKFLHVMSSIVIMRIAGSLLDDLLQKVQDAGQNSIRKALSTRMTRHILSQDLGE
jgi:hypothetical protein